MELRKLPLILPAIFLTWTLVFPLLRSNALTHFANELDAVSISVIFAIHLGAVAICQAIVSIAYLTVGGWIKRPTMETLMIIFFTVSFELLFLLRTNPMYSYNECRDWLCEISYLTADCIRIIIYGSILLPVYIASP